MPSAWFIGDVHRKFHELMNKPVFQLAEQAIFQLGDMGIFEPKDLNRIPHKSKIMFIRGNHDNPVVCQKSKQYLGDFGANPDMSIFWLSGAMSTDTYKRTEGKDWWRDEQLNQQQCTEALKLYTKSLPRLVMSHDCPSIIFKHMWPGANRQEANPPTTNNNTINLLDMMWTTHKPEYWVFGHHHRTQVCNIQGCSAVCVDELDEVYINWNQ